MKKGIDVVVMDKSRYAEWDDFVRRSENGTMFHSASWLSRCDDIMILGCFNGSLLVAGLPVAIGRLCGVKTAYTPPLAVYSGIVFGVSNAKYAESVSKHRYQAVALIQELLRQRFGWVRINTSPGYEDLIPFIHAKFQTSVKYTYRLALSDLDGVWRGMTDSRRNDIRSAQRDGITVMATTAFDDVFALVEKTFARQDRQASFRVSARRYHDLALQEGRCRAFVAKDASGKSLAVAYIVWDDRRSYYFLGGYDAQSRHHGATALCLWEAMRFSREELGLMEFDFKGSLQPQLERFFRKFGARLLPYYQLMWCIVSLRPVFYVFNELKHLSVAKRIADRIGRNV